MIVFYHILWWSSVWLYIEWFDADLGIFSWFAIWIGEFERFLYLALNLKDLLFIYSFVGDAGLKVEEYYFVIL